MALSSEHVRKYEFLTGEKVSPGKVLLGKAATIKRFEYSPLSNGKSKLTLQKTISRTKQGLWIS